MKRSILLSFALVLLLVAGCRIASITGPIGDFVGGGIGKLVKTAGNAVDSAVAGMEDFTPEQEYYLGRGVAASILGRYPPLGNPAADEYLNLLGQSLALHASPPHPFGGYRFLVMDSTEVNAFSAPGGFVLLTRGLISDVENEDELAAVLAHEIAHIQLKHGIDHAWFNKMIQGLKDAGNTTADTLLTSKGRGLLNTVYNNTVDNVVLTLLNKGYTNSDEQDADKEALLILQRAGYSGAALPKVLARLNSRSVARGGFGKTHPAPADRIKALDVSGTVPPNTVRQQRFSAALRGLTHERR